jgi:predicted homoserine dehydrogenase-like protein
MAGAHIPSVKFNACICAWAASSRAVQQYIVLQYIVTNTIYCLIKSRGNYNIIQNFAHFAKSCNDLQYHFVVSYYIIHIEMSISKSYATFVRNYNIIHMSSLTVGETIIAKRDVNGLNTAKVENLWTTKNEEKKIRTTKPLLLCTITYVQH